MADRLFSRERIELVKSKWSYVDPVVTPFVNKLLHFGVPALVLVIVLQITSGTTAPLEIQLNVLAAFVFALLVVRPRLVGVSTKVILLGLYFAARIVSSFYFKGLFGSGEVMIALLVVLSVVVLRPYPAIVVSGLAVASVFSFALLSPLGVDSSLQQAVAAGTAPAYWLGAGTILGVFSGFTIIVVNYLRTNLLQTIDRLERANNELEKGKAQIEQLAYYDSLTGLPNRHRFEAIVDERIRSGTRSAALVIFDIRNFRAINTLFGTQFGDHILGTIGSLVAHLADSDHTFARLSGDEFALWVEEYNSERLVKETRQTTASLLREIQEKYNIRFSLNLRTAVARYAEDGDDYQSLAQAAAAAMKFAKQTGNDSPVFYNEEIMEMMRRNAMMQGHLEKAVMNDEFTVEYQAKVSIRTGDTVGVEALARWNNPYLGNVSPEIFIEELTKLDRIAEFSIDIIEKVLSDIPQLRKQFGAELKVSINVPPVVFLEDGFVEVVLQRLRAHAITPDTVVLEITEDIFVDDKPRIERVFKELRSHGIGISLDDFGKGYSSLSYLSSFEFTEIKVDRLFIQNICSDSKSYALFRSICRIAEAYDYKVVAEGVETAEQIEMLKTAGCEIAQGYYFSRPEPLIG